MAFTPPSIAVTEVHERGARVCLQVQRTVREDVEQPQQSKGIDA